MNYYNILGVNKTASPDEIKRAYRKLAMQHHPDKGGDEKTFQQINEAYDTLKDTTKRTQYDNPRPQNSFTMNTNNFEDIFGAFFNQRQQRRNQDIKLQVEITLEDVLHGKNLVANYTMLDGQRSSASVHIHPGVEHGQGIKFKGIGDNSFKNAPPGDLYIIVKVKQHNEFKRERNHLIIKQEINVFDLISGTKVLVKTIKGSKIEVSIPKGTQPNTLLSVSEYGLPDQRTGRFGNLYIDIKAVVPKVTDESLIERVKSLNDAINRST